MISSLQRLPPRSQSSPAASMRDPSTQHIGGRQFFKNSLELDRVPTLPLLNGSLGQSVRFNSIGKKFEYVDIAYASFSRMRIVPCGFCGKERRVSEEFLPQK